MDEASWSRQQLFGYVPKRAIAPAAPPGEGIPPARTRPIPVAGEPAPRLAAHPPEAPAKPVPLAKDPRAGDLPRARAELEAARAELRASEQRRGEAERAHAGEVDELRRSLAAATGEAATLRAELQACRQSEVHLQRYCDRLEARLARAQAENERLRGPT